MRIKLLRMPMRFQTSDGEMEITVRVADEQKFLAAAAFITAGSRALSRVPITQKCNSHGEVMRTLLTGFDVSFSAYSPDSVERRVLESLCRSKGVEEIDES
jgi:hypothetical protein